MFTFAAADASKLRQVNHLMYSLAEAQSGAVIRGQESCLLGDLGSGHRCVTDVQESGGRQRLCLSLGEISFRWI